jgi:hypothetical protein
MPVLICPLCGLRFISRPLFELHVREDHPRSRTKDPQPERLRIPQPRPRDPQTNARTHK